jgi:hypothetical protein
MKIRLSFLKLPLALAGLAAAAAPLACGSSGGSSPAGDFCTKYATAYCQKLFACPDPNFPLPPTATQADCVSATAMSCTNRPSMDVTVDVNCYGATSVNAAAETSCINQINATTCTDFNGGGANFDATCATVCSAAPATGGAGTSGTAGSGAAGSGAAGSGAAGSGGAPGSTPPRNATDYCAQLTGVSCSIVFRCVPAANRGMTFMAQFGTSVQDCTTSMVQTSCGTAQTDCPGFDPAQAQACLQQWNAESCADVADMITPDACMLACP